MREDEKIIEIGRYKIDVSNISLDKKIKATKMWNKTNGIKCHADGSPLRKDGEVVMFKRNITENQFTKEVIKIGLYLLRQEFIVLKRRFTLKETIKEMVKRSFISYRYIKSLTSKDVEGFASWVYEELTGKKKETGTIIQKVVETVNNVTEEMTEEEISQFTRFVTISFLELAGKWNTFSASQKATY